MAQLSGVSSFADAGYATAYDPTGAAPFTVTALFRGNPTDTRTNGIVGHSNNSWRIYLNTSGRLQCQLGTNQTSAITSAGVYNDGNWHQLIEVYTPASTPGVNGTNALFVDGALDTSVSTVSPNGIGPGSPMDVMIGSDPQYTNSPIGLGRQLAGQVCEVALFTNALTASQISTLYNALDVAPYITGQPVSGVVGENSSFTNTVVAYGSSLAFQWYTNGLALAGQTNASLILNPVTIGDAVTNYYVIVTNDYGSVTSAVVSLSVLSAPVIQSYSPVPYTSPFTLFAGASPTLSISVVGAALTYQWYTNGVVMGAATNASLTLTNVQAAFSNDYCIVTNVYGSATSYVWAASVIADPSYPYPATVLSDSPVDYWRLDEQSGLICHDYMGGNDGIYTNVTLGNAGYNSSDPETSAGFGFAGTLPVMNNFAGQIQGVDFAAPNGATANFTVEAWVNGEEPQSSAASILSKGVYGVNDTWTFDFDTSSSHFYRFYIRTANGSVVTCTSALATDAGIWHHLVGVCDESDGVVNFYIDGSLAASASVGTTAGAYEAAGYPAQIGSAQSAIGGNYTLQYEGFVNDVAAYNYALSASQVAAQFASVGNVAPYFIQKPPLSLTVNAGATLTIPAAIIGTPAVSEKWVDQTTSTTVATGSTNGALLNATLTVNDVPGSWNGNTLQLSANNSYGSTNASVVLTVLTTPQIAPNIPSQVMLKVGQNYTYSIGVTGPTPDAYQWFLDGSPIFMMTNSTFTATAGDPGTATVYVVVTNNYGATTSVISSLVIVATPTNAYAQSILNLDPVGYWPMHEVESAAQGDVEKNYGSLGLLGTGYYPDWVTNGTAIQHQVSGALALDPDTATYFNYTGGDNSGTTSNSLYIPHTSPLATLQPPFTVECWFNATAGHDEECIWGQSGFEGLNAGASGGGVGNVSGIQLYTGPAQTSVQFYNNGTLSAFNQNITFSQWNHYVLTCDANTNLAVYINGGQPAGGGTFTYAAAGLYSPDYWTPFEVGDSRGNSRAFQGSVDEVAIYPTNLTAADISTHYNDGISGAAGAYFHDVTNDNPLIYLRMDASAYTAPAPGTWPPLLNFGGSGVSGVYNPGTMPGIVAGPSGTNGAPWTGLSVTNVAQLSGVSSFADAGYASAYNPVGATPFSVVAMFRGDPADNRIQAIVGHSDNSWRILMTPNGTLESQLGTNGASEINSTGIYNDGSWHQLADVYSPGSNPNTTGTHSLYVDGMLDTSVSTVSTNGILPGSTLDVIIGGDPEYTNNPAGVGRQFSGQVCDVALFASALTGAQVQALYSTAVTGTNSVVINPNPTNIVFSVTGDQLTLSWPMDHTGWQLQAQTNGVSIGLSNNWVNVANSRSTNQVIIPVNLSNGSVFYRLVYP